MKKMLPVLAVAIYSRGLCPKNILKHYAWNDSSLEERIEVPIQIMGR